MIPKTIFRYSKVHDDILKFHRETWYKLNKDSETKKNLDNWASKDKIRNYIEKIKPLWKKEEKRILKEIAQITKLKWQEPIIKVYFTGNFTPYSDPLTI